jgi:hypothetical protein
MKARFWTIIFLTGFAMSWSIGSVEAGEKPDSRTRNPIEVAQDFVVCTGWHALCTASPDCRMNGDTADCDCLRVNEPHIVATAEIQDSAVKRLTLTECTNEHPCDVDEAPVCKAIQEGRYKAG